MFLSSPRSVHFVLIALHQAEDPGFFGHGYFLWGLLSHLFCICLRLNFPRTHPFQPDRDRAGRGWVGATTWVPGFLWILYLGAPRGQQGVSTLGTPGVGWRCRPYFRCLGFRRWSALGGGGGTWVLVGHCNLWAPGYSNTILTDEGEVWWDLHPGFWWSLNPGDFWSLIRAKHQAPCIDYCSFILTDEGGVRRGDVAGWGATSRLTDSTHDRALLRHVTAMNTQSTLVNGGWGII